MYTLGHASPTTAAKNTTTDATTASRAISPTHRLCPSLPSLLAASAF